MLLKASSRSVSITINFFADYLKSFLPGCQFGFGHLVKNGTNLPKANGSTATNRWSLLNQNVRQVSPFMSRKDSAAANSGLLHLEKPVK